MMRTVQHEAASWERGTKEQWVFMMSGPLSTLGLMPSLSDGDGPPLRCLALHMAATFPCWQFSKERFWCSGGCRFAQLTQRAANIFKHVNQSTISKQSRKTWQDYKSNGAWITYLPCLWCFLTDEFVSSYSLLSLAFLLHRQGAPSGLEPGIMQLCTSRNTMLLLFLLLCGLETHNTQGQ